MRGIKLMVKYQCIDELIRRFPELEKTNASINKAIDKIIECYQKGGKLLICGNGGSCSDSEHIVGELLKGFNKKRKLSKELCEKIYSLDESLCQTKMAERLQESLPAISLTSQSSIITAIANDLGADLIYAQQLLGLGKSGDILIGISTSGNADNVYKAAVVAKATGLTTIALTGQDGGRLADICDVIIKAPSNKTPMVQEYHLSIYHVICDAVEQYFFDN
jgi:D-sedoheptulose 7-phosphate isomerase